jgi:UPF0755 protein
VLIALVVAVLAVVFAGRAMLSTSSAASGAPAADPHGATITVVVPSGSTADQIADILEERKVVQDGGRFKSYAESQSEGTSFKAGTYTFQAGTGYDQIIKQLDHGPNVKYLTIPEGYRLTQIEALLPAVGLNPHRYAQAVRRASPPPGFGHHVNMEGFMFPATYTITADESESELVSQQLAAFSQAWSHVDTKYARSKNLTDYDVLKIASMIEREATAAGDRAKVSAVIYNRLHRNMALGIDATILYYKGSWTAKITSADLQNPEPYNNRVHKGLPPTPICNPGLAAMQAAAKPGPYNYLYYVAVPGQAAQYFTDNYSDFLHHGG